MNENVFYRLAPFIQDYIYRNNWTELRAVQVEACRVIFDTEAHLLLSSGTASGKTEAAFLPILTKITEDPPATIGVLYIAPLKALINDQFFRLNDLLREANVPVWHWHGDVTVSHKQKMLRQPSGILQITPESLESMLINKNRDLVRLFGDLRFVVIDEVHAFMGTDRGTQILCQLERLQRYMRNIPRRVGLSATLGDYSVAEKWLASGTELPVITPSVRTGGQKVRISVEHFYEPEEDDEKDKKCKVRNSGEIKDIDSGCIEKGHAGDVKNDILNIKDGNAGSNTDMDSDEAGKEDMLPKASPYWEYLYEKSLGRKCIIFTNLREQAETTIATLQHIAELRGSPDIYHVHHGSVSAAFREAAESEMKESEGPVVIGATVSLEMGIDIGRLERVIQIDAPNSVSSFLQRLGRTGRRGNPSEMWFVCKEEKTSVLQLLPYQIPWRLLQIIAIIQLYLEERWIEPVKEMKYPLSVLYHQTMSTIAGMGEISFEALAKRMLGMYPFSHITVEDYSELIKHLVDIEHLQVTEEGGLIIGLKGEKIVGNHRFFAVFPEEDEYMVIADSRQIGKVEVPPPLGERMTLAGRTWEVTDVDMKRKTVYVKRIKGRIKTYWQGGNLKTNNRILERMRRIFTEDTVYQYLQEGARRRLAEACSLARKAGLDKYNVFSLGGNTVCIFPWLGSIDYYTLLFLIKRFCSEELDIKSIGGQPPNFILVRLGHGTVQDLLDCIKRVLEQDIDLFSVLTEDDVTELKMHFEYKTPKFDQFIPPSLLKKGLICDYIDMEHMKKEVNSWSCADLGGE